MSGSKFIGDLAHIASINVLDGPAFGTGVIPDIVLCFFELMFAATAATSTRSFLAIDVHFPFSVITGAVAERGRMWPMMVFIFVWCTLVYNPIARWIWSPNGWAYTLGTLDYAGGVPVHMTAGTSALVYCFMLGPRQPVTHAEQNRPHNINNIFIGTLLSWFGWFGFNGGSGLVVSSRAVLTCVVTNLAASTGGLTWCTLDYFLSKPRFKFTLFGFCMGSMAGLVCITPASGYVGLPSSLVFGIGGSTCVYFGRKIKVFLKIDDAFDIFAQHGVGGFVGCLLTGIFAQKSIPELDQTTISGGWLDRHWMQFVYQLALACKEHFSLFIREIYAHIFLAAGFVWSFSITLIILLIMNRIPGLVLRTRTEGELDGTDFDEFNEFTHDYISIQRDLYMVSPRSTPTDNIITVATVNNQNVVHKQNDIRMVQIKTVSNTDSAWER